MLHMGARGDLRHHPAIGRVLVDLRCHQVGQHPAVVGYHRGRGLIAAGLDSEHDHRPIGLSRFLL